MCLKSADLSICGCWVRPLRHDWKWLPVTFRRFSEPCVMAHMSSTDSEVHPATTECLLGFASTTSSQIQEIFWVWGGSPHTPGLLWPLNTSQLQLEVMEANQKWFPVTSGRLFEDSESPAWHPEGLARPCMSPHGGINVSPWFHNPHILVYLGGHETELWIPRAHCTAFSVLKTMHYKILHI